MVYRSEAAGRDHPRMCGEHYKHRGSITPNPGSSPHVRGARMALWNHATAIRDHPRMCGEHYDGRKSFYGKAGSSPHVRGALEQALQFEI